MSRDVVSLMNINYISNFARDITEIIEKYLCYMEGKQ